MVTMACRGCNSRDTVCCRVSQLARTQAGKGIADAVARNCTVGCVTDPVTLAGIVEAVKEAMRAGRALFSWLQARLIHNPYLLVCNSCGRWERLSGLPTS
jgi:hypothetical protein